MEWRKHVYEAKEGCITTRSVFSSHAKLIQLSESLEVKTKPAHWTLAPVCIKLRYLGGILECCDIMTIWGYVIIFDLRVEFYILYRHSFKHNSEAKKASIMPE